MKKARPITASKSSTCGNLPKSSGKSSNILGSTPKTSSVPSSSSKPFGSSYSSTSYNVPKKGKPSTSFGIVWIPGKRRNKHKDLAYNSRHSDRSRDRSPSMYNFMSGDSSNHQNFLEKKEDKSCLLVPEPKQNSSIGILGAGTVVASEVSPDVSSNRDEKVELIKHEGESKEAAGDTADTLKKNIEKENLAGNEKVLTQPPQLNKDKLEDNVDSVFLRSPPPHKTRSAASTIEEESCGMKCLYYTLQCCDCVLM